MRLSPVESKKRQIASWVKKIRKSDCKVLVSNYSYHCFFSGHPVSKTLIVLPDEVDTKGVITINKPLIEIEMPDLIKVYSKIKG